MDRYNPLTGLAHDTTPPAHPGAITPPVHQQFGVQHFGGPTFPLAPDIARSRAEMFYPVRPGTFIDMEMVMHHGVQVETYDRGYLPDLMFYPLPGLNVQFPSANLPTHLPLEGISYNNVQISEEDYLALATQRVRAALGGG